MAEEASGELAWVLRPPEPGHVRVCVSLGEGVELTQEQRAALEALASAFYEEEVAGFGMTCRPEHCGILRACAVDFCFDYACEVQKNFKSFFGT
jgi:hypothetical protein